jgi:hypothetical protein
MRILHLPSGDVELILGTTGITPGGIWHYRGGVWTLRNTGLPASWRWSVSFASPRLSDAWVIHGLPVGVQLTNDGGTIHAGVGGLDVVWRSTDAGLTWYPAPMTDVTGTFSANESTLRVRLDTDDWLFYANPNPTFIIRGSGNAGTQVFTATPSVTQDPTALGQAGDFIVQLLTGRIAYLADGASSLTTPTGSPIGSIGMMTTVTLANRVLFAVVGTTLFRTSDYRTTQPVTTGISGISEIAAANGKAWVTTASGICELLDPLGVPSIGPVIVAGSYTRLVAAQQANNGIAVVAHTGSSIVWTDGVTTTTIPYPSGVTSANVGSFDVIV